MKCEANFRFATSLSVAGRLHHVACESGDVIDLDDEVVAELAIQIPGGLSPAKPAPKPEKADTPEPEPVEMVEGLTDEAATRAVAKKPAAKKPARKP